MKRLLRGSVLPATVMTLMLAIFAVAGVSNFDAIQLSDYLDVDDSLSVNDVAITSTWGCVLDSLGYNALTCVGIFKPWRAVRVVKFDVFAIDTVGGAANRTDSLQIYFRSGSAVTQQRLWIPTGTKYATYSTAFNIAAATPCSLFVIDDDGDAEADHATVTNVTAYIQDR